MQDIASSRTATPDSSSAIAGGKIAVSWPAILAGAFVAAGSSLILVALGSGIGFAAVSPWANHGVAATSFAVTTAIWLIVTQWVSAALGGYIAGRLRVRWIGTHAHEVFFRDTAHGLVTWAVATVAIVVVIGSSASGGIGGAVKAAAGAATGGEDRATMALAPAADYRLDRLFRAADTAESPKHLAASRAQATRIVANAITTGELPEDDKTYLASMVASDTGVSQGDAQKRVDDFVSVAKDLEFKLRAEADTARRAASQASIYLSLSLLIGAFIGSVSAALGGRLRDEHP